MDFNESAKNFLEAVIAELGVEDATAMFVFLGSVIKTNPGKLRGIAKALKDPETLKEVQDIATTKNKMALIGKVTKLYKKLS